MALKIIGYTVIYILFLIFILYLGLSVLLGYIGDEANQKRLIESHLYDQKVFPHLATSIFFYKRMHGGDEGNWVVVYPLDNLTKNEFLRKYHLNIAAKNKLLSKYQQQINLEKTQNIECIKPTVKKRWKSWNSNIHYVQPDEWAKDHNDYKVHDSFIVYGSEKHIKTVEKSCMNAKFKVLADPDKFPHNYWAISEEENLFFSVYDID